MKRKIVWIALAVLLAVAWYEFGPDGSAEEGIPAGTTPEVRREIARLRSRRPARRCEAALELGRLSAGDAARRLVPLLSDEEEAMGPVERILQSLMMGSPSRKVADCAATALGQLANLATGDLIGAVDNADTRIKSRALRVLALSSDTRAVEFMAARIDDADAGVRRQALISVAQNRHRERARAIQQALRDPNAETRGLALTFIDANDAPWGFPATLQAASDPDAAVRGTAADRLGALGDARAIDALIDRLSDGDPGVRQRALNSLRLLTNADRGSDPAAWRQWRAQQR